MALASGFIYLVAVEGVTGTGKQAGGNLRETVECIKGNSDIPVMMGFGISGPEHLEALGELGADGFIVGSQICRLYREALVEGEEGQGLSKVESFAEMMKRASEDLT